MAQARWERMSSPLARARQESDNSEGPKVSARSNSKSDLREGADLKASILAREAIHEGWYKHQTPLTFAFEHY